MKPTIATVLLNSILTAKITVHLLSLLFLLSEPKMVFNILIMSCIGSLILIIFFWLRKMLETNENEIAQRVFIAP